jgi:hypothetical protein
MKNLFFLPLLFITSCTIRIPQLQKNNDQTELLIRLLSKQCNIDSNQVAKTVRAYHRKCNIIRTEFVYSKTRASYYLLNGVLRMNIADSSKICELWVAELSHAVQLGDKFSKDFFKYSFLALRDMRRTVARSFFPTKAEQLKIDSLVKEGCPKLKAKGWVVWQRTHKEPGTFEYIAHELIEKELMKEILKQFHGIARASRFFYIKTKKGDF